MYKNLVYFKFDQIEFLILSQTESHTPVTTIYHSSHTNNRKKAAVIVEINLYLVVDVLLWPRFLVTGLNMD